MFPFFWRGFAPYHGQEKLLLMAEAWRYKRNGVKMLQKGKNLISGSKTYVLKFPILYPTHARNQTIAMPSSMLDSSSMSRNAR